MTERKVAAFPWREKFKYCAAVLCDVAAMPVRALWHDLTTGYRIGKKIGAPIITTLLYAGTSLAFTLPAILSVPVAKAMWPMGDDRIYWGLAIPFFIASVYAVAYEHPVIDLKRENWERFPLSNAVLKANQPHLN
jgi:hypothetical protein